MLKFKLQHVGTYLLLAVLFPANILNTALCHLFITVTHNRNCQLSKHPVKPQNSWFHVSYRGAWRHIKPEHIRPNLVRMSRSRLILCCFEIHAARYSLSAVFSTSLLSLWISCFSDATYSRSCFRWWARVWISGFTIFTSTQAES